MSARGPPGYGRCVPAPVSQGGAVPAHQLLPPSDKVPFESRSAGRVWTTDALSAVSPYSLSASSPSRSQMTVIGLLRILLRALYLLLAADGGVRERPYFVPLVDKDAVGDDGANASQRLHSSDALFPRPGEAQGLCGAVGEEGEQAGGSSADSERVRWKRGSVERSISAADMRKLLSERLPFFRRRALKVSLLVDDFRRLRWMELLWRGRDGTAAGGAPVGVTGGEWEWLRDLSSSDSLRPRTFRLDL